MAQPLKHRQFDSGYATFADSSDKSFKLCWLLTAVGAPCYRQQIRLTVPKLIKKKTKILVFAFMLVLVLVN